MYFNLENRRYTGSKASLSDWIVSLIESECKGETFVDLFAGTGAVSNKVLKNYKKIIINDFLYSNNLIYKAFFEDLTWDKNRINSFAQRYNQINFGGLEDNYFSANFGNKFFNYEDAKKIGFIREDLEKAKNDLTEKEYNILLASLLYSVDKIANTVGHYDAYFRNKQLEPKFVFRLIKPVKTDKVEIYREDANSLASKIKADIAYIDPPYNSRQYSRFYHVLENLTTWEKPELHGVALKPEPENMSDYCRVKAVDVFSNLIEKLDCNYVVVSYNNTYNSKSNSSKNKITLETIEDILRQKGETSIYECSHKFFNSGKTDFKNHKELLFITRVKN